MTSATHITLGNRTATRRLVAESLIIAAVYAASGHLGQFLSIPPGNVTILWPPSGIALAAILLLGWRAVAGIWLGALIINGINFYDGSIGGFSTPAVVVAVTIAIGSFLQPLFGRYLVTRYSNARDPFRTGMDTAKFFGIAPIMCLISASVCVLSLAGGGLLPWEATTHTWMVWWLGDTAGVVVFAPLLLSFARLPWRKSAALTVLLAAAFVLTYQASTTLRNQADQVWYDAADRTATRLSTTLMSRLDRVYNPINGLSALFKGSTHVGEDEFLDMIDSFEGSQSDLMPTAIALALPLDQEQGKFQIAYSTEASGVLAGGQKIAPDTPLSAAIAAALVRPDMPNLAAAIKERGHFAGALVSITANSGEQSGVVIALVDYPAIIEGLISLEVPAGIQFRLSGQLANDPATVHHLFGSTDATPGATTTYTVRANSALSQLAMSWDIMPDFRGGPSQELANAALIGGTLATILITILITFLFIQNQAITEQVKEQTQELTAEIEHRQHAEESLRRRTALAELQRRLTMLANDASDAEAAMQRCLDEICAFTGWPVGHVYELNPDNPDSVIPSTIWHLDDAERFAPFREATECTQFEAGVGLPGRVLASGEPAWIRNVSEDLNFPRAEVCKEAGIRGAFAIPVVANSNVVAVLEFYSNDVAMPDSGFLEDITNFGVQLGQILERKLAEAQLAQREEWFRSLLESAPDATIIIDLNGTILQVNNHAETLFGYSRDELLGKSAEVLIPDAARTDYEMLRDRFMASSEPLILGHSRDLLARKKSGETFPAEISISPIQAAEGLQIVAAMRDVTERKEAEARMAAQLADLNDARRASLNMMADLDIERQRAEELRVEAEAATETKSAFLAAMSHEIRTPMNGVVGMIDLLRETEVTTDQGQMLTTIRDSAFALLQIINDILDFSKIEAGRMTLEYIPVSIRDLLDGVVATLIPNATKKNLTVLGFADPAIPD